MPADPTLPPVLYLLDSDICGYLIGPYHHELKAKFATIPTPLIGASTVVKAEAWYGMERNNLGLRRRFAIQEFFSSIRIVKWSSVSAEIYGDLRASIERSGTTIGDHDIMIAAHALAIDATLVTNNTRHFARFAPPLRLENSLTL